MCYSNTEIVSREREKDAYVAHWGEHPRNAERHWSKARTAWKNIFTIMRLVCMRFQVQRAIYIENILNDNRFLETNFSEINKFHPYTRLWLGICAIHGLHEQTRPILCAAKMLFAEQICTIAWRAVKDLIALINGVAQRLITCAECW